MRVGDYMPLFSALLRRKGKKVVQISVIGCGHLGATHAACMASIGHEVVGVDIDSGRVELLNSGRAWFYEPGLDVLLAENIKAGRLRFTTSFAEAAAFARTQFAQCPPLCG